MVPDKRIDHGHQPLSGKTVVAINEGHLYFWWTLAGVCARSNGRDAARTNIPKLLNTSFLGRDCRFVFCLRSARCRRHPRIQGCKLINLRRMVNPAYYVFKFSDLPANRTHKVRIYDIDLLSIDKCAPVCSQDLCGAGP